MTKNFPEKKLFNKRERDDATFSGIFKVFSFDFWVQRIILSMFFWRKLTRVSVFYSCLERRRWWSCGWWLLLNSLSSSWALWCIFFTRSIYSAPPSPEIYLRTLMITCSSQMWMSTTTIKVKAMSKVCLLLYWFMGSLVLAKG